VAGKLTHIWIARHGQTVTNREGRFCGHSETDLTDLGRAQAAALGERLRATPLAAVYTSDYRRAIETAALAAAGRGLAPRVEPDLREVHYGEWELQKESEIRKSSPHQYRLMREEHPDWRPPGGEQLGAVRERTARALRQIAREHAGQHVLVVSHGTAIACMLSEVLAMAPTHTLRLETANCGLSLVLAQGERLAVAQLNETQFLANVNGRKA
jgi:broad specificity phosphatase PhoE